MKQSLLFKDINIGSYFKFATNYFNRCSCKEEDAFPIYIKINIDLSLCYFCKRFYTTAYDLEIISITYILI